MVFRYTLYNALGSVFAGKFSFGSVASVAAAASVAVFVSGERHSYKDWADAYYGPEQGKFAARKIIKLPPLEDAQAMSRIVLTADDEFSNSLRTRSFWRSRGGTNSSKYIRKVKRSGLIGRGAGGLFLDPFGESRIRRAPGRQPQSGLYRTMCVRSCDGFMWPVSFSTTKSNFGVDENICRNSCAAPTRLYYYENPGQQPIDMVDRRGRSYNVLPTAWRYQQQHVSSCKCRPDPWEPQAMARHVKYAALKQQGRLKRYLKKASRKAKRLSRRASIGSIVVNSSFEAVKPKRRNRKLARRKAPKIIRPKNASGFSSKSYASGTRSRATFRAAFGTNR